MAGKLKNIPAKAHPPHYMMHRYWGRKPHNVVNEYLRFYSKKGDVILDPFMGSGVTIIEALKEERNAVGIDLNPLSQFIVKGTIEPVDLDLLLKTYNKISEELRKKYEYLYQTNCSICFSKSILVNAIYKEDKLKRVKGICSNCGSFKKNADKDDELRLLKIDKLFTKMKDLGNIDLPDDEILQFVKRSGRTHIKQLFTNRALIILSELKREILKSSNKKIKNSLMMCFSSMLPNVSRMIPGDYENISGKSGWVISKIWVPKIHTEKNIFISLESRFKKILAGKKESNHLIKSRKYKLFTKSSEYLKNLSPDSIDYIFTDPPYGDSIAYLGLSMFFNSWLGLKPAYSREIIYDPFRGKRYDDYHNRMQKVFSELYRVIKPGKFLSFSFNNRDLQIWESVMESVKIAGFEFKNVTYQEQAVSSGTQGINYKNTLRGDFIYTFQKLTKPTKYPDNRNLNPNKIILKKIHSLFEDKDFITSDYLFEKIIPFIIKRGLYRDENRKYIDLDKLVSTQFKYKEISSKDKLFAWVKNIKL